MPSRRKRILSLLLAMTMIFSGGCGKKEKSLLEGTILENARVFNCDGDIIIGGYTDIFGAHHPHFKDLISGIVFAANECKQGNIKKFDNLTELGVITSFLTEDELLKIVSDKLTDEDVYNILIRITTSEITKEDSKILSLTGK